MERTIRGKIRKWGLTLKFVNNRPYRTVHIDGDTTEPKYGHQIFGDEEGLIHIEKEIPVGSEVEFKEKQSESNAKYWNMVGELNIIKLEKPSSIQHNRENVIIRQTCIKAAALMTQDVDIALDIAKKFESYILDKND